MRLELETQRFYLGRDYSEAIEAAGGLPVHIPLISNREYLETLVDGLDGILLPGCDTDVDPGYYGEDPHPRLGKVVPEKDETDLLVLSAAEERKLPVLAICYGMQVLNVARGGTLIQDIESEVSDCLKHRQGLPLDRNSHSLKLSSKGILAELAGESDNVRVNSHHHQAVRKIGRNLEGVAWANDGIIEGIQDVRPERFVLGVQWHPELSWRWDSFSRSIFERFVTMCVVNAGSSTRTTELEVVGTG